MVRDKHKFHDRALFVTNATEFRWEQTSFSSLFFEDDMEVRVNVTMDNIFTDMCFGMWNWLDYSEDGVPQYYV